MACQNNLKRGGLAAVKCGIFNLSNKAAVSAITLGQAVNDVPAPAKTTIARTATTVGLAVGGALWAGETKRAAVRQLEAKAIHTLIKRTTAAAVGGATARAPEVGAAAMAQAAAKLKAIKESMPEMGATLTPEARQQLAGQCERALTWIRHIRETAGDSSAVQDFVVGAALEDKFGVGAGPRVKGPSAAKAALGGLAAGSLVAGPLAATIIISRRRARFRQKQAKEAAAGAASPKMRRVKVRKRQPADERKSAAATDRKGQGQ